MTLLPVSHFLLMSIYALLVSSFFSLLWRRSRQGRIRLFVQLLVGMLVGGLLIAWLMYPFPSGPPTPFPDS